MAPHRQARSDRRPRDDLRLSGSPGRHDRENSAEEESMFVSQPGSPSPGVQVQPHGAPGPDDDGSPEDGSGSEDGSESENSGFGDDSVYVATHNDNAVKGRKKGARKAQGGAADGLVCANCMGMDATILGIQQRLQGLTLENAELSRTIKVKDAEIRRLESLLADKNIDPETGARMLGVRKANVREWPALVQEYIHDADPEERELIWEDIWKQSNREENMSISLQCLHPGIRLIAKDRYSDAESNIGSVSSRETSVAVSPRPGSESPSTQFFRNLPDEILLKILTGVLDFSASTRSSPDGQLVYVLSRLDPFVVPSDDPHQASTIRRRSGLPGRFYISGAPRSFTSLTYDTIDPSSLLAPLCVCRKWCYYGNFAFYGRNTFAFSSFGEFDRFCIGIGPARVQRLAHVELHWMGGASKVRFADQDYELQSPACFEERNGRIEIMRVKDAAGRKAGRAQKDESRDPLAWLSQETMPRLQTMTVWIDESSKSVIRRPFEPRNEVKQAAKNTSGQPNARLTRALRLVHGWDYLHQLRGLDWIRLYDTHKYLQNFSRSRSFVRDLSAVLDLNNTCRQSKTPYRARQALIRRLDPLFPLRAGVWSPDNSAYEVAKKVYSGRPSDGLTDNIFDRNAPNRRTPSPSPEPSVDSDSGASSDTGPHTDGGDDDGRDGDGSVGSDDSGVSYGTDGSSSSGGDQGDQGDQGSQRKERPEPGEAVDESFVRRERTNQYIRAGPYASRQSEPAAEMADPNLALPVIKIDDSSDDEVQIIQTRELMTPALVDRSRSQSRLFVRSFPDERLSLTRNTGPPATANTAPPRAVTETIDLTLDSDDEEDPRRAHTAPTEAHGVKRAFGATLREPVDGRQLKKMRASWYQEPNWTNNIAKSEQ